MMTLTPMTVKDIKKVFFLKKRDNWCLFEES